MKTEMCIHCFMGQTWKDKKYAKNIIFPREYINKPCEAHKDMGEI